MSDLLAAQSILLAVLTALAGMWAARFDEAKAIKVPTIYSDGANAHKRVRSTLWRYAVPLVFYAFVLTLILVPSSYRIIVGSMRNVSERREASLNDFDEIQATLLAVHFGYIVLFLYLLNVSSEIGRVDRKFNDVKKQSP